MRNLSIFRSLSCFREFGPFLGLLKGEQEPAIRQKKHLFEMWEEEKMKAFKLNSKHILPVALLGLLSLNVSWESWMNIQGISSLDQASEEATQVCENANNDVITALASAKSNPSSTSSFFMEKQDGENGNFKDRVNGQNIYYKGKVNVQALTPQYMTKEEMHQAGLLSQQGGGAPTLGETTSTAPLYSNDTEGLLIDGQYQTEVDPDNTDETRIVKVPRKYLVFNVSVSSETDSEAATCEECFKENVTRSRTKQVWIKVFPNVANVNNISCQKVYDEAVDLFKSAKEDMVSEVRSEIREIARIAEEEELRDERKRLINSCQIKRSATLDDIREYEEEGEIDEAHSYAGDTNGKLRCHRRKLNKLNGEERHTYFREHMYKEVRSLLTSSNAEERKMGQDLLNRMYNGEFGPMMNIDRQLMRQARSAMSVINRVYDLKKRHDQTSNSLVKDSLAMQIEQLTGSLDLESTRRMGQDEEFDYWHGAIRDILQDSGWQVAGDDPVGVMNLSGRLQRGGTGLSERLMDDIRGLTARFNQNNFKHGYYNGPEGMGVDGLANSTGFRRTSPPGPERMHMSARN